MNTGVALRRRSLRPASVAACTWGAAAFGAAAVPPALVALVLAGLAVSSAALFWRIRRAWIGVAAVALACSAAASGSVAAVEPLRAAAASLSVDGGRHIDAEVTVTGHVASTADGTGWFDAVASRVVVGAEQLRGALPVRVGLADAGDAAGERPAFGSTAVISGTAFLAERTERAILVLRADSAVSVTSPTGVWAWLQGLRAGLVASVRSLPGPGAGLVPGLAVGDTSTLAPATEQAMTATSLSHLTAVSGANCALVVAAAFGILALCRAPRLLRVLGATIVLVGFVLLVTPEPSVVRAAAMALIAMLSVALGRPAVGVAILSAAVTIALVVDPWLATSLGFALSAVATAALLVLARPIADGLERWMPRALALALAVPTAAQVACGPLIVLIDPHVPLLGVAANLLADPAAAPATVAGVLACIAPVPWLRDGLAAIAWLPASWIAAVAHTTAAVPAQNLPWPPGPVGALMLAGVGAAAVVVMWRPTERVRRWRRAAVVFLAVGVGVTTGQAAVRTVAGPLTVPGAWQVAMCDVGQGDATLWRSGASIALVDTGPDPERLTACLDRFGIGRVDLLVLTHFDLDHVGGVAAVRGRVDLVLHGPTGEPADERILADLAATGTRLERAAIGRSGLLGATTWRVVWPPTTVPPGNDASIVVDVTGPAFPRTLLLGDLGAEPQRALLRRVDLPPVRVVKVSHHGSADQDADLYRRLQADVGLIGVGADNDYGHPTASLLSTLLATGTRVGRTDRDGALAVWIDAAGRLTLWRERGADPAPGGSSAAAAVVPSR